MCKNDTKRVVTQQKEANISGRGAPRLLLSLDSYDYHLREQNHKKHDNDDEYVQADVNSSRSSMPIPNFSSMAGTCLLIVTVFCVMEQAGRQVFEKLQQSDMLSSVLDNETNRHILARHVFVDSFACFVCAYLGWCHRHDWYQKLTTSGSSSQKQQHKNNNNGLFAYHGGAMRLALFFFAYQVKNLYDTIVWGDGWEFIFHHIFSMVTAYGSMTKLGGCGHTYALFFFGISEMSTAVLCLLANFDDVHGVPGLGEALPLTKVALGGVFVVLFILCRCLLWPWTSYHFGTDIVTELKKKNQDKHPWVRRAWMTFYLVSLTGLSILQVAWLGQIFVLGKQELAAAGLL